MRRMLFAFLALVTPLGRRMSARSPMSLEKAITSPCSTSHGGATLLHSSEVSMCWSAASGAKSNPIRSTPP
jgi:hypothetical protein